MAAALSPLGPLNQDRVRGCLLGGAVGDALGAPIEFRTLTAIREQYGAGGLATYGTAYGRRGAITDDTQMTIYTVEGLLRASVRQRTKGIAHAPTVVLQAYLRWLDAQTFDTQTFDTQTLDTQTSVPAVPQDGWLSTVTELRTRRSPGWTCVRALTAIAAGTQPGRPGAPINDSKGCGGVMRAAPAGFPWADPAQAFELGCELAALTHGHPSGYLPAGFVAAVVAQTVRGRDLDSALDAARAVLADFDTTGETTSAVDQAISVAHRGHVTAEAIEQLGAGWTGEEALAIALCAALTGGTLAERLRLAVNHSGDSDSTGAICGNLVGSVAGASAIPAAWLTDLELHDVLETLADDAVQEFGPSPPDSAAWTERYPPR